MEKQVSIRIRQDVPHPPLFRICLADSSGRYFEPQDSAFVYRYAPDLVWSYAKSGATYNLSPGTYFYCISAGPAWSFEFGKITVSEKSPSTKEVFLKRIFEPRRENWASCDVHVHTWGGPHKFGEIFAAEDIDLAGIQYWGIYTSGNSAEEPPGRGTFRIGDTWVTSDEEVECHSPWGVWEDTTVVGLPESLPDLREGFGYRMNAQFYAEARKRGCRMIVYQAPTWAQFPVDVALGLVDSVNVCDNYFSIVRPADGPWEYTQYSVKDTSQKEPFGMALWIFRNYYRVLNAGFRLPVSGGSAYPTGGGGGPVGMNRFYIDVENNSRVDEYFANWQAGRTFATNGPILLASVDGHGPSVHRLNAKHGGSQLALRLISNRPMERLEWVADGEVVASKDISGRDPPLDETWETELDVGRHQWLAARCFGKSERTFFADGGRVSPPFLTAHSSPFYFAGFGEASASRHEAARQLCEHIDWMRAVVEGKRDAAFANMPFSEKPLGEREKGEIFQTLAAARRIYQARI